MSFPGPSLMEWPTGVRRAFPAVVGALALGAALTPALVAGVGVRAIRGGRPRPQTMILASLAASGVYAGARIARRRFVRKTRDAARVIDPGFRQPPSSSLVSTGPGSLIADRGIGREGARYVGTATTQGDVSFVTGLRAICEPIRVFVGLDAAATVAERVDLAMAELRRTDAFERGHLLVQAPAGTGYANSTPVDVVEILALGDCASVAVGYGLLPSFLSLNRVQLARETQAALLEAIAKECRYRTDRPRILLYGESLGAKVQQGAMPAGVVDLDRLEIDRALWVGTPGGKDYDDVHRLFAQVSVTIDRPEQLPLSADNHTRVWFLEHDGDPVVRFRPDLAFARPAWLAHGSIRGRGIPEGMRWRPAMTWAQVLVDTVYATNVSPGDFRSAGHDYRADLGAVVTSAYGLSDARFAAGWQVRLEQRLRDIEVRRAERISGENAS